MKTILLNGTDFTFDPANKQIDFANTANFQPARLYAVINATTNKTIYTVNGDATGLGGTFAGDVLTYDSSNAGQNIADDLMAIYENPSAIQVVQGDVNITSFPEDPLDVLIPGAIDVLGSVVTATRNNQIEIEFDQAPGASLITNTFTGSGSAAVANGHTIYQTGTTGTSSAKGVSVQETVYRAHHETYSAFTAAFLNGTANSYQRIGLYDSNNGFFIGFEGTTFGVTVRSGGADTRITQANFNTDKLDGGQASKFTRRGDIEAVDFGLSNLYRIRFAWLGSANIYFEILSPDGEWVLFHNIRQPNFAYNPSIADPNLPMTIDVNKTSGAQNVSIATACWAAGTTSTLSRITETITDRTLAMTTRGVIYGKTTAGGGGYNAVKVNPSGALTVEADVTASVLPTGAATSANQVTGNNSLSSIDGKIPSNLTVTSTRLLVDGSGVTQPVSAASLPLPAGAATESTLSGMSAKLPATLGAQTTANSMAVNIASDQVVNVSLPDVNFAGAATTTTNNNILNTVAGTAALDVSGYRTAYVQIVSTATTGTIVFETSQDNINFQNMNGVRQERNDGFVTSGNVSLTSSNFIYAIPLIGRYFRCRISGAISAGTLQAFVRLTQMQHSMVALPVTQLDQNNLAVSVTGATVRAIAPGTTSDIASGSLTGSANTAAITPVSTMIQMQYAVTAVSGSGSLDVTIEESLDGGTTWTAIYSYPRITGTGTFWTPLLKLRGRAYRYAQTLSGFSSVTRSATRILRSEPTTIVGSVIDRTIVPNTLNSTSASVYIHNLYNMNMIVRCTAQTTAATIALQFSEDNTNWWTSGVTLSTVNGIAQAKTTNEQWQYARAIVSSAGTGITLAELTIKGTET